MPLTPSARSFVVRHSGLLLCLVAISVLVYPWAMILVAMELVAWLPFLFATARRIAPRLTAFLYVFALSCAGFAAGLNLHPIGPASMLDPRLLVISFATAISILLLVRQFVFVFKRTAPRGRLKTRRRFHFGVFHLMQWTIAAAIVSTIIRFMPTTHQWDTLVTLALFHGVVIAASVSFSVWFWLSPNSISDCIDYIVVLIVLLVPMVAVTTITGSGAFLWVAGVSFASLPYSMYLIWVCSGARRRGIRVGRNTRHGMQSRRLPKRIDVIELESSIGTGHADTNRWS